MTEPPKSPLRFQPSYEKPEDGEAETVVALRDTMRKILETTYQDYGFPVRSVHAKGHGLVKAELRVPEGLPDVLAQGMFARPGTHGCVLRFSTTPGDLLDDKVSSPRGVAIKVLGVEGERLPGSEGATTQDFLMANGPAFAAARAKDFLGNLKLLAATTDTPQAWKKVASAVFRTAERAVEAVGGESVTLKSLGGHPLTHILGETFYTQVPILYGEHIAKLSLAPVAPDLAALKDRAVDMSGRPDALREEVSAWFAEHGAEWELRAQLCTDLQTMPIEDASVVWPEDKSPYVAVARITAGPQPSWSEERKRAMDEGLSFSPWHGIAAHRPLGSVMRARKPSYEMSSTFRATHGCPIHEPRQLDDLP